MLKHIGPKPSQSNGVYLYANKIDQIIHDKINLSPEKDILHFELGYGSHSELWKIWSMRNKLNSTKLVVTLHDPPIIVGKPFYEFISSEFLLSRAIRKLLDITLGQIVIKRVVKLANAIIVLNPLGVNLVSKQFGIDEKKVYYTPLPNLVPVHDIPTTKEGILFFGNLAKHKGLDTLIAAYQESKVKDKLILAGGWGDNKQYRDNIEKLITQNSSITITGRISDERLSDLLARAMMVVLPYEDPGIIHASGPLISGMSAGKAVIASDIPIFSAYINNGINGLLFESGNIESLAMKIKFLANNLSELKSIENAASEFAKNEFSEQKIANKLREVYLNL